MELVDKLDDYGKPAWIVVMIVGFIIFWPIGLAILAYLLWSGRMGCWRQGRSDRWHEKTMERARSAREAWRRSRRSSASGNWAFDEYREETLQRLEEEQREFQAYLERLRHAKDKSEFDQFMAERNGATSGGSATPPEADDNRGHPSPEGPAPFPA